MEWLAFAVNWEKVVGLTLALFGAILAVVRYFWGRVNSRVETGVSGLKAGHHDIARRLDAVEEDVGSIRSKVEKSERRLHTLEGKLGLLASKEDLALVNINLAKIEATGQATSSKVDSLYRGVIDRAERS